MFQFLRRIIWQMTWPTVLGGGAGTQKRLVARMPNLLNSAMLRFFITSYFCCSQFRYYNTVDPSCHVELIFRNVGITWPVVPPQDRDQLCVLVFSQPKASGLEFFVPARTDLVVNVSLHSLAVGDHWSFQFQVREFKQFSSFQVFASEKFADHSS